MPRKKKNKPIRFSSDIDFGNKDYVDYNMSRDRARQKFARQLNETAGRRFDNQEGIRDTYNFDVGYSPSGATRFFLSSPASYKNGGGVRKKARQIARKAVERQKAVAKNLKKTDRSAGRALMKRVREDKRRIKKNYIQTRKDIKEQLKNK